MKGNTPVFRIMQGDTKVWPTNDAIIDFALSYVTSSESTQSVTLNSSFSATLTADTGYEIASVSVVMGNTDITSTAYSNGVITIADVTGDVVITAVAGVPTDITPTYTVTAKKAIKADGSVISSSNFSYTSPVQVQ